MVNEEKVRLMTKAALYEEHEGKKALVMNRYSRGDFITLKLIGAWVSYTAAFLLCLALWAFCRMEYLLENLYNMDFLRMGQGLGLLYLSLLGIFLVINYVVWYRRYQYNQKDLNAYQHILKQLSHFYQSEEKHSGVDLTSGGTAKDEDLTGI